MDELFQQLLAHIRGIWRFRWTSLAIGWVVTGAAWGGIYTLPDRFEASARVHVDTQSLLKPLLRGLAVRTNTEQRVRFMTRTLLSQPNLEKVARMTDLDLQAKTPSQMEHLLDGLRERIRLDSAGRVNLYRITYRDTDPERARRVVQALVTLFVEKSLGESRQDSRAAQEFLNEKIKEYERRLEAAEKRLMEFKREHTGEMPDERGDYYERLQAKMAKLEEARFRLEAATDRRDELKEQLAGESPSFGIMQRAAGGEGQSLLDRRIAELQGQLDQLLLKYTDKHPDVQGLQATLERLREERRRRREKVAGQPGDQPVETSTFYQRLRTALAEARAEVASLQSQVRQYERQVGELKEKVDTIPKVEAKLAQLNRDYRINQENYEKLLARRESARISEEAERSNDSVKFKVVDPPRVDSKPVAPDRPLLVSGGLFGGLGAGFAFGLFLAQIRPVFDSRRSLYEATGLPVLGTVSQVKTRRTTFKRALEISTFLLGVLTLLAAYAAAMALVFWGPPGPVEGLASSLEVIP